MRKIYLSFVFLPFLAAAVQAQTPMSGAQFDAYTRGKTLTYMQSGIAYGAEQYLEGRKVIWAFDDDECRRGTWSEPEPGAICFVYPESTDIEQCWKFFRTPGGLQAEYVGETDGPALYEARQSNAPLLCLGPKVGV